MRKAICLLGALGLVTLTAGCAQDSQYPTTAYSPGYSTAYSPGYTTGYSTAYNPNYTSGYATAYNPGYRSGYSTAYGPHLYRLGSPQRPLLELRPTRL